jgi:hypothetical protein
MSMKNYRDLSTGSRELNAGFQFEFFCEQCDDSWRSPFKPYRVGQATAWYQRFASLFYSFTAVRISRVTDTLLDSNMMAAKAKAQALEEAEATASQRFQRCSNCHRYVCANDWSSSAQQCVTCAGNNAGDDRAGTADAAIACPNCQTPSQGGRFCHECGFDMASTHKSCPACGATMGRQARFCTDCGHGF